MVKMGKSKYRSQGMRRRALLKSLILAPFAGLLSKPGLESRAKVKPLHRDRLFFYCGAATPHVEARIDKYNVDKPF